MLQNLRLINFRRFESYTLNFTQRTYLVGPNNAGKSTILTALRLADSLIRFAHRRNPTSTFQDASGSSYLCYPVSLTDFQALRESVRHNFRTDHESRIELRWKSSAALTAVWPAEDGEADQDPCFYLQSRPGMQPRSTHQVRERFPRLGIVPILSPIEYSEAYVSDATVRSNLATRTASRNFRNQLRLLDHEGSLGDFWAFAREWLREFDSFQLESHLSSDGQVIDLIVSEAGSRVPKELIWAGDGIQIWFQILYHLFRMRAYGTVVLDEPEVFLHPDLQRRLARLLEESDQQVVVATHSAEIAAEVEPEDIVLVDRLKRRSVRAKSAEVEGRIGSALGSQFNLRLARALRSRAVLFVEGDDLALLRPIFRTLGLDQLAAERGVAVISLGGFGGSLRVEPFSWLVKELLPEALRMFVLLDRDYRTDAAIFAVESEFEEQGITTHVWRRKELESYILCKQSLARTLRVEPEDAADLLAKAAGELEHDVFGALIAQAIDDAGGGVHRFAQVSAEVKVEFDQSWPSEEFRQKVVPPKKRLAIINRRRQEAGHSSTSFRALARETRLLDYPEEFVAALARIEGVISD